MIYTIRCIHMHMYCIHMYMYFIHHFSISCTTTCFFCAYHPSSGWLKKLNWWHASDPKAKDLQMPNHSLNNCNQTACKISESKRIREFGCEKRKNGSTRQLYNCTHFVHSYFVFHMYVHFIHNYTHVWAFYTHFLYIFYLFFYIFYIFSIYLLYIFYIFSI